MANVNGTEINLMPTDGMRKEAEKYRKWKKEGEGGGTDVARTRATQILSGNELSPDTVITMNAWFARHESDKSGEGYRPGEPGYPSNGRVAWAAWGGDPGQTWARAKSNSIKKARERTMTEETKTEHRAEPDGLKVGDFVRWNSSGGTARGKIDRIVRDGSIDVPDSSFTITGTPDDPAALITLYRNGEATDRKVGHKFSTLTKIAAIRSVDAGDRFERKEVTDFKNVKSRTFEFPFSSEYPVKRYFGNEVLSHEDGAADLSRLNDGGAVLFNHNMDKPIGVVESAYIGEDKRGYAKIRFSRSKFASEILEDVKDGILRGISFGYSINDTVVVFDRIRENLSKKESPFSELLNLSINQTLSRILMTSITTLLALLALYIFGGEVVRGFVSAMMWGVLIGTYSSIFIASPLIALLGFKIIKQNQ